MRNLRIPAHRRRKAPRIAVFSLPALAALTAFAVSAAPAAAGARSFAAAPVATGPVAAPPPSPAPTPATLPATAAPDFGGDDFSRRVSEIRSRVYPALVNISVVQRFFQQGHAKRMPAGGSGVIVSPDGYVLTNHHVAFRASRIVCRLPDGEELEASVVTDDPLTDLSVLKLRLDRRAGGAAPLPFAVLGDATVLDVGDQVLAMGNPMLLGSSMTLGIVSNAHRVFTSSTADDLREMDLGEGDRTGLLTRWIQHDALILPGNSGGPLVDMKGEVVGINELGGGGVGFAIPANVAASVLAAARQGSDVVRGWLGIGVLPVQKAGLDHGALISEVWPGSPAAQAGLEPGDVLRAIDGAPVEARFFEQVPLVYQAVADIKPGTTVRLDFERQGAPRTATAHVARMARFVGTEAELPELGASVQEITEAMALFRGFPDTAGLLITGVRPGRPFESAKPALAQGDVLLAIGDTPTPSLDAARSAVRQLGKGRFKVTFRREREVLVASASAAQERPDESDTELPKAWLGVRTQVLTPELAQALNLGAAHGLRISEVLPYTRAKESGLRVGDVVVAVDGQKLTSSRPQDTHDLQRRVEALPVNRPFALDLLRDGRPLTLQVVAEPKPKGAELAAKATQSDLEFSVREIVAADRMEGDLALLPEKQGVLVSDVTEGGLAGLAGLEVGDVVLAVDDQPLDGIASFDRAIGAAQARRARFVKLYLHRGHKTHFVFIEPEWQQPASR
jgi:serine protease Do